VADACLNANAAKIAELLIAAIVQMTKEQLNQKN